MTPRYYQAEAVDSIYRYFDDNTGNPIVAMPTGTGKSIVIAEFLRSVFQYYPGQRVMMLTHVKELIAQNFEKLLRIWPTAPAGIYSAGLKRRDVGHKIIFAGIASVAGKSELFGHVDLVLLDECHLLSPKDGTMYRSFLSDLYARNPSLKIIGLSATPYRMGQGLLTDEYRDGTPALFTDICYDITAREPFNRLVAEGYISPLVPKRTGTEYDLTGVGSTGDDYILSELQSAVDKDEITKAAIEEMICFGVGRKHWLVFATGINHAKHVAGMLEQRGIKSAALHSKMSSSERDLIVADYKAGRLRAVVNNNILTTGFDFPEIDLIGVMRPTISVVLWVQMLGRGTRPATGKVNCLVLDFAGNTRRLGPINDPVLPRRPGQKNGKGVAPVKVCEACGTYNHASAVVCGHCGAEFPREVKIEATASTEELIADGLPQIEIFRVDRVIYSRYARPGRPTSLKVTYECGLRRFAEWVCFEHTGYALHKAHDWWKVRSDTEVPNTVDDAESRIGLLKTPTHIRVWLNRKYPQVMAHDFTGSAFDSE